MSEHIENAIAISVAEAWKENYDLDKMPLVESWVAIYSYIDEEGVKRIAWQGTAGDLIHETMGLVEYLQSHLKILHWDNFMQAHYRRED